MADMVASAVQAVVQETVSGAVSFMVSSREEKASKTKRRRMERLEMAHSELEFALERSRKMPITSVSLLCRLQMFEHAFEECDDALYKRKVRILENDEEADQQVVTRTSSLPKKFLVAIKTYVSSFFTPNKDELSCSDVGRFEWFADKASKFVRDVESGFSVGHLRFFRPLLRQLLEGTTLCYKMVRGSQTHHLFIEPLHSEEPEDLVALLWFSREDREITARCFTLALMLRLSESTDIVGITTKCLQSLGPQFNSLADEATIGELTRLLTQDVFHARSLFSRLMLLTLHLLNIVWRPDGVLSRVSDTNLSESSNRFPEQVTSVYVHSYVSAESLTTNQADMNIVKDWPPLRLSALFLPLHHSVPGLPACLRECFSQEDFRVAMVGRQRKNINVCLEQRGEMVGTKAINRFIRQPELSLYGMSWVTGHGGLFTVWNPGNVIWRPKELVATDCATVALSFAISFTKLSKARRRHLYGATGRFCHSEEGELHRQVKETYLWFKTIRKTMVQEV